MQRFATSNALICAHFSLIFSHAVARQTLAYHQNYYKVPEDFTAYDQDGDHAYIIFNPKQVRSGELVTFDDEQNPILTEQRGNGGTEDARFSSRAAFFRPREEVDAEYADAVAEGTFSVAYTHQI